MTDPQIRLEGGEHSVLLIHGLTGSPFELKSLARSLHRAGFSVRCPLLAGHGTNLADLVNTRWEDWYETVRSAAMDMRRQYTTVSVSGLCMGSLLALCLASDKESDVTALSLLSTTLFYDGWSLPWYRFLLPVSYFPPFKYFYSFGEREPYGVKNERMRREVALSLKENSIAYDRFPSRCLQQLFRLIQRTKKILPLVTVPALIIHAREDDVVSTKNADYVERRIGSKNARKVLLDDSYHMVTLDNQKELVAEETIRFFREATGFPHGQLRIGQELVSG